MNTPLQIRLMSLADIDQVVAIEEISFKTAWTEDLFVRELLENQAARYLVIEDGGRILAYAGIWLIVGEGHITNLAVHPESRGQGLGKAMLGALLRLAACYGIQAATLEVRPSNKEALGLYHGFGFVVEGRRPGYYSDTQEDALLMWKRNITEVEVDEEECHGIFGVLYEE